MGILFLLSLIQIVFPISMGLRLFRMAFSILGISTVSFTRLGLEQARHTPTRATQASPPILPTAPPLRGIGGFLFLHPAYRAFHALGHVCMFHVLAVPGEADIPFSIYHDQAACAGGFGSEKGNCCCGCIAGSFSKGYNVSSSFSNQ